MNNLILTNTKLFEKHLGNIMITLNHYGRTEIQITINYCVIIQNKYFGGR